MSSLKPRKAPMACSCGIAVLLSLIASGAFAACYEGIRIYYQDGTHQDCAVFCTFPGGWICRPA